MNGGMLIANRYMLQGSIGAGAMSIVYLASDIKRRNAKVAVKILRRELSEDTKKVQQFEHEARAVENLNNQHIIKVLDFGHSGDIHYLVMEYVPGYTLKDLIMQRGRVNPREAVAIAVAILDALKHSHEHGIIHGDVKPQNVLLSKDGVIKLSDFGIAIIKGKGGTNVAGKVVGSAQYLSPEQAKGYVATEQSDLYSVAVILYEMLTGRLPFDADEVSAVLFKQVRETPTPPKELAPNISDALQQIIMKGLDKESAFRYQTAEDMIQDLQQALRVPRGGFVKTERSDVPDGPKKVVKRGAKNGWSRAKKRTVILSIISAVVLTAVIAAALIIINRTGSELVMPSVINMSLTDAQRQLTSVGLNATVTEAYHDEIPSGYVIRQSPERGTAVSSGDSVIITVSRGMDRVMVPVLTGYSRSEAVRILDEQSIKISEEKLVVSNYEAGTVVSQSPEAGNWINPDEGVSLEISGASVLIPDVINEPLDQATTDLETLGLKVVARVYYPSSDAIEGNIMSIQPEVGTLVLRGSDVTLTVYTAPPVVYTQQIDVSFAVATDNPYASVRAVLVDSGGNETEVYRGDSAPTDNMTLNLTLEQSNAGLYQFIVYVDDAVVVNETVSFD